jgi:hypothetical protein
MVLIRCAIINTVRFRVDKAGNSIQLEEDLAHRARCHIEPVLLMTFASKGSNQPQTLKRLEHSLTKPSFDAVA